MSRSRELLIANASWWAGWCTDHEGVLPELTQLSGLLMEVKDQMRADRPEEDEWEIRWPNGHPDVPNMWRATYKERPDFDLRGGVLSVRTISVWRLVGPVGSEQKK